MFKKLIKIKERKMKFGVCCDYEKLPLVIAAGYDYIELNMTRLIKMDDVEYAKLVNIFDESPIKAETYNCFFPGEIRLVGDTFDLGAIRAFAAKGFERAARIGGRVAVLGSGGQRRIPEGYDRETAVRQFTEVMRVVGDEAAKVGMTVALEPLNFWETNLVNRVSEGYELVKSVSHPNVKMLVDFYHLAMVGDTADDVIALGSDLVHCHIARPDRDRRVPASESDLEACKAWAEALKEIGYDGRISVEASMPDFENDIAVVRTALDIFRA